MTALIETVPAAVSAVVLAEVQGGVLVRSFLIAVVLIAPVWFLVRKRVLAGRVPQEPEPEDAPEQSDGPQLEAVIASIAAVAESARDGGSATLTIPSGVTIDGRPADAATVDALVRDSLRRSGLVAVAEIDSPAGRTLELRELSTGSPTD